MNCPRCAASWDDYASVRADGEFDDYLGYSVGIVVCEGCQSLMWMPGAEAVTEGDIALLSPEQRRALFRCFEMGIAQLGR